MGRTNPTFRACLDRFVDEWQAYRRGLRCEHQAAFDDLLEQADRFAAAAGNQNAADPERAILLSMLLAHHLQLAALAERIEAATGAETGAEAGDGGEGLEGDGAESPAHASSPSPSPSPSVSSPDPDE